MEEFKEFKEFQEDRNQTFNYLLKDGRTREAENEVRWSILVLLNAGFLNSCNSLNSFESSFSREGY
jgi:hypothetical protein